VDTSCHMGLCPTIILTFFSNFRIERAVLELKELEALTSRPTESQQSYEGQDLTEDDLEDGFDGDLTFVGLVMADIPLDVHLTKLILMGHVFGFLEEAIIMACSTSQQSFFLREFDYKKQLQTFYSQHSWSNDSESDLLAGECHGQADAEWIVVRRQLGGHNDTPLGCPTPARSIGRPGIGYRQGVFAVFSYE
jgi:HrpA-like RNA helicase